jgi:hypothetical protein
MKLRKKYIIKDQNSFSSDKALESIIIWTDNYRAALLSHYLRTKNKKIKEACY